MGPPLRFFEYIIMSHLRGGCRFIVGHSRQCGERLRQRRSWQLWTPTGTGIDVSRDGDGLDVLQPWVVLSHRSKRHFSARGRHPDIAVTDGRGKEFDKTAGGAFTLSADNRRPAFEPSAGGGII